MIPAKLLRSTAVIAQLLIHLLFTSPSGTHADNSCGDIADRITHGGIVWNENAIFVQGTAAPNLSDPHKPVSAVKQETQRAATLDAYRKAAEILAGVNITGDRMASDNPQVTTRIQAYIRQPQICRAKYYADGGVDMVVKVPLSGELAQALLPEAGTSVAAASSNFSGLIIDASDLPFSPALCPRLLAPDGRILFGQENVSAEVIRLGSVVRYVNYEKQITSEMVGARPLKTSAVTLGPQSPSDLILDERAAKTLKNLPVFIGKGKIAIITSIPQPFSCRDLFAEVNDQRIDWERKMVLARGFGRMTFSGKEDQAVRIRMMERAAEVDAQRRLLELLLDVQVDSGSRLKDTPSKSKVLQGIVRNAIRCGAQYFRDGSAEVVLAAPIDGIVVEGTKQAGEPQVLGPTVSGKAATGLIIDTSGTRYYPSLAPELAAPGGSVVYGRKTAARGWVYLHGFVGFQRTMDAARSDPRIGPRPVIVRADPDSQMPQRLVLSTTDADKLDLIRQMLVPLGQGRVIIVTEHTTAQ